MVFIGATPLSSVGLAQPGVLTVTTEPTPGAVIGRGLDVACEYSVADLNENREWVVGDLSRLNRVLF